MRGQNLLLPLTQEISMGIDISIYRQEMNRSVYVQKVQNNAHPLIVLLKEVLQKVLFQWTFVARESQWLPEVPATLAATTECFLISNWLSKRTQQMWQKEILPLEGKVTVHGCLSL